MSSRPPRGSRHLESSRILGVSRLLGVALAVAATALGAAPLAAQAPTAPGKAAKEVDPLTAVPPPAVGDVDWRTWSEAETVARLVYGPVKRLGLSPFTHESRVELKAVMDRVEARLRALVRAVTSGEVRRADADGALEAELLQYSSALQDLSTVR